LARLELVDADADATIGVADGKLDLHGLAVEIGAPVAPLAQGGRVQPLALVVRERRDRDVADRAQGGTRKAQPQPGGAVRTDDLPDDDRLALDAVVRSRVPVVRLDAR
jgi:hypothetical protein